MGTRVHVTLDTVAFDFARAYANAKGIALGVAISELIRRAAQIPESSSSRLKKSRHGYFVMAKTGAVVTPETIKKSSEDDLG